VLGGPRADPAGCRSPGGALSRSRGRPSRGFPQQPHRAGRCRTVWSGFPLSCIVAPGWPFGRPGLRPDFPRSDFGAGFASPSDDGGLDEFRELDCTRAARSATCDCSAARCSRSAAISASCSAIRVFRSSSSSRSRAFAARSPAVSSARRAPRARATLHHDQPSPANRRPSNRKQPAAAPLKQGGSADAAGRSRLSGDALAHSAAGRAWDNTGCAYLAHARGPGRAGRR